jgi:hypothetical protein
MERDIRVAKLGRSIEVGQFLSKASYRVAISEGSNNVVVEARITEGTLEMVSDPEKRIEEWFTGRPLPQSNTVIDIPSLD